MHTIRIKGKKYSGKRSQRNTLLVNGQDTDWDISGIPDADLPQYTRTYVLDYLIPGPEAPDER